MEKVMMCRPIHEKNDIRNHQPQMGLSESSGSIQHQNKGERELTGGLVLVNAQIL